MSVASEQSNNKDVPAVKKQKTKASKNGNQKQR